GYQYDASVYDAAHQFRVGRHGGPAQQIVDIDVANVADQILAGGEVGDSGQDPELYRQGAEACDQFPLDGAGRQRRGDDDFVDAEIGDHAFEVGHRIDTKAEHIHAREGGVLADETDHVALAGGRQRV